MHAPASRIAITVPELSRHDMAASLVPVATAFALLAAFGANRNDLALLAAAVAGLQLLLLLTIPGFQRSLRDRTGLVVPGALFLLAMAAAAWGLTPYSPDGPHPAWTYVAAAPAIALDRSAVLIGLVKLAGLAASFLSGVVVCGSERRSRLFFRGLLVAGGAYGVWSLLAHAISPDAVLGVPNQMHGGRLTATLFNANAAGTLFGMLLVMALAQFLAEVQGGNGRALNLAWRSLVPAIALAVFATCLALSTSRGAFAATIIGVLVLMIWTRFARNWRTETARSIFVSVGYLVLAGVLLAAGDVVVDRYATAVQDWQTQRTVIYATHWSAFLSAPWFGYGLGSFDAVNKLLMTSENYGLLWNVRAAHNVYLQWLEEGGIAAALPMFAAVGAVLVTIGRGALRRRSSRNKLVLRGLLAASLVVLVHGWSDFALQVPAVAAFWALLLGCGVGIARSSHDAEPPVAATSAVPAAVAIGSVSLAAGGLLFAELALGAPALVPLGPVYADWAGTALGNGAIAASAQWTRQELAQNPADTAAWLRLAYGTTLISHAVNDQTSALIERSFLVGPLDPDVFEWRTRFALENWDRVSPAVRDDVLAAIRASWTVWPQKMVISRLAPAIANPAGRLALTLTVHQLADDEAAARAAPAPAGFR